MAFQGEHKIIPIKGIARAGADTVCEDGAMNEIIGLEYKDGSYIPYKETLLTAKLPSGTKRFYTHRTSYGENVIATWWGNNKYVLKYIPYERFETGADIKEAEWTNLYTSDVEVELDFVGNSINITSSKETAYYVFNGTSYQNRTYAPSNYSNHLLRFRVTRGIAGHDKINGELPVAVQSLKCTHYRDTTGYGSDIKNNFDEFLSVVNNKGDGSSLLTKAQGLLTEKGGLYGYFLVCFAYRLRNGDLRYASAPLLMCPPCIKQKDNIVSSNSNKDTEIFTNLYKKKDSFKGSPNDGDYEAWHSRGEIKSSYPQIGAQLVRIDGINSVYGEFRETAYESVCAEAYQYLLGTSYKKDSSHDNIFDSDASQAQKTFYSHLWDNIDGEYTQKTVQSIQMGASISLWIKNGQSGDEASKQDKAYKTVTTHAISNKLQFGISSDDIKDIPDDVSSVCIFISDQVSPFSNITEDAYVDVHGPFLDGYSSQASGTVSSDFKMMYTYTPQYRDVKLVEKDIRNLKSFYLAKEIYIEELKSMASNQWQDVDLRGLLGDTLLTRETLPVTAFDYTSFRANKIKSYNYRIHLADTTTLLANGYGWLSFINDWQSGYGQWFSTDYSDNFTANIGNRTGSFAFVTHLRNEDNSESIVVSEVIENSKKQYNCLNSFIAYPDTRAYKMDVYRYTGGKFELVKTCDLVANKYLGISYYLDASLKDTSYSIGDASTLWDAEALRKKSSNTERYDENSIRVSDVAFPSIFPHKNTIRVGSGKIIGLARLPIAMSQDTYGQHPLLVFTTEGIFSLEVDKTGNVAYSTFNMFSNEVCVNPNSICELSGAVLFVSNKGLMIANEGGVEFFCPMLNGLPNHTPMDSNSNGLGMQWYKTMVSNGQVTTDLYESICKAEGFREYVISEECDVKCNVTYITSKNKVIVYRHDKKYCYFIDIQTRIATALPLNILTDNNSYPNTLFYNGNSVLEFEHFPYVEGTDILLQTRPIKISHGLKSYYRVVLRGKFETAKQGKVAILLVLGSVDGEYWIPIGKMEKSLDNSFHDIGCVTDRVSVNYMMVIFAGNLGEPSHIDSIELTMDNKYNNKLR